MASADDRQGERAAAFERARLDYCRSVFEREENRREGLERKAQFYLSFVTLVLAAVFLKPDYLDLIGDTIAGRPLPAPAAVILIVSMAVLGLSLVLTTITILAAVQVHKYRGEYPADLTDALFMPDSGYLAEESEAHMICVAAMNYAVAVEANRALNDRKAARLRLAAAGALLTVLALATLLATMTVLAVAG